MEGGYASGRTLCYRLLEVQTHIQEVEYRRLRIVVHRPSVARGAGLIMFDLSYGKEENDIQGVS